MINANELDIETQRLLSRHLPLGPEYLHDDLDPVGCRCRLSQVRRLEWDSVCSECGGPTVRTGTCTTCTECGATGGCG